MILTALALSTVPGFIYVGLEKFVMHSNVAVMGAR